MTKSPQLAALVEQPFELLQELERRTLRMHAETESLAERVKTARARVVEMEELRSGLAQMADPSGARALRGSEVAAGIEPEDQAGREEAQVGEAEIEERVGAER